MPVTQVKTLSIAEVLMNLNNGGTVEEIQSAIREVTKAVVDTGNKGQVTIVLDIARNGNSENQLIVKDTIKKTLPKAPKPATLFFATDEGHLSRQNPNQMTMEDRLV